MSFPPLSELSQLSPCSGEGARQRQERSGWSGWPCQLWLGVAPRPFSLLQWVKPTSVCLGAGNAPIRGDMPPRWGVTRPPLPMCFSTTRASVHIPLPSPLPPLFPFTVPPPSVLLPSFILPIGHDGVVQVLPGRRDADCVAARNGGCGAG